MTNFSVNFIERQKKTRQKMLFILFETKEMSLYSNGSEGLVEQYVAYRCRTIYELLLLKMARRYRPDDLLEPE